MWILILFSKQVPALETAGILFVAELLTNSHCFKVRNQVSLFKINHPASHWLDGITVKDDNST